MKNLFWILCSVLIFSCSSGKKITGKTAAEKLYREAENFVSRKRYLSAIERLNILRSQHPYSYYATPAELLMADIKFLQKDFVDAAASYQAFRDLHPKHPRMDYIVFKIAESYFKQMPDTFDRDLTATHQAQDFFRELLMKYPRSQYVKEVKGRIDKTQEMIEEKEKSIADFYFKTEKYSAARYRYLNILKAFKNQNLLNHARLRIVQSSYYMGEYRECLSYLKSYAKKFTNREAKDAKEWADDCGDELKEKLQAARETQKKG